MLSKGMAIVTDEKVAAFVARQLGVQLCPPFTCMGTERDGWIVNGVVFNCFEGPNVHVTIAGKHWNRELITSVGEYVFNQLGCLRMTVTTEQPAVVGYAIRLGGKQEGVLRDYYGHGRDGVIVGILREEWRFKL